MWESGRRSQIALEMKVYNLEALEISEIHRTQAGRKILAAVYMRSCSVAVQRSEKCIYLVGNLMDPESSKFSFKESRSVLL